MLLYNLNNMLLSVAVAGPPVSLATSTTSRTAKTILDDSWRNIVGVIKVVRKSDARFAPLRKLIMSEKEWFANLVMGWKCVGKGIGSRWN
jgi:hypothetical protein